MSPGTTGSTNYALGTSSTKLSFVPNTGVLSATSFSGGQYIANQSISGSATQGAFAYGTLNGSDTGIFASYQTSIAGYAYMALQNTSSNAAATTDIALYNDTASLGKYIDIGINSSAFTGTGNFSLANAGYIYTNGGDLVLGTYSSNGIHFIINNGATDAVTINTSGAIAVNGAYGTAGQLLTSQGSGSAPTWTSGTALTITDDTSTNATRYLTFTSATSGTVTSENVSSTKLQYNPSTGTLKSVGQFSSDSTFGFKNRIINGAMVIDQRNAGASGTAAGYTVDRWSMSSNLSTKGTWQQNAGSITPPVGFTNYLGFTSNSAYTLASGDFFSFVQPIEGYNVADLGFGTANAKTVTLSFWVRSSLTGTFGGSLGNNGSSRCYPYTYTINSANTWEQKTVTIAGDTSGTWLTTNGNGLFVSLAFGVGSTYSGTAGSWASANYLSATGATSVVGTSGATFYITGVQLEKGSTATSFDYRPYGTELALCQRYFTSFVGLVAFSQYGIGEAWSTTKVRFPMQCPVPMRAAPTFSTAGSGFVWAVDRIGSVVSSLTLNYATTQIQSISGTGSSLTIGQAGSINAGNFTDTSMSFSAEL